MTLSSGTRFGAFEIVAPIGAGGMGEVYRARDTRLKRDVAIKVLPDAVASDEERVARFQREAELLATLAHPHIASIYGLEVVGEDRALVMELVDGETLADRIARGAMPLDEALPIARQIVDALDYAHEHRVLHRDLKPANIKVTSDGQVKILDFGLAKALEQAGETGGAGQAGLASRAGVADLTNSPTLTSPAYTQEGIILGTAAYMSPEQARGTVVDERSDVWAFGVVLFEMLTGRQAFAGESVSDTMAAVLRAEPEWTHLPADTPASMRRLLRHCLVKDRKLRLRAIGDARFELEESLEYVRTAPDATQRAVKSSSLPRMMIAALAGAAIAVLAIFAGRIVRPSATDSTTSEEPIYFKLTAADYPGLNPTVVFEVSPDGRFVALLAPSSSGGGSELGVISLNDRVFRQLGRPQSGGNTRLAWSPDSRSLLLRQAGGVVSRVERDGRVTQTVLPLGATSTGPLAWGPDDQFMFVAPGRNVMLSRLGGGDPRVILKAADRRYTSPAFLEDGRSILVGQGPVWDSDIVLASLDGSRVPSVIGRGYYPAWVPPGFVVAAQGSRLGAWRFDGNNPLLGDGVTLTDQLMLRPTNDVGFAVSKRTLVYRSQQSWATRLTWFDRQGLESGTLKFDLDCRNPELAPNGVTVAVECFDPAFGSRDMWVYDLAREVGTRFTTHPGDDSDPLWSPDGQTLMFTSTRQGENDIFSKSIGGAKPEELLFDLPTDTGTTNSWSPDGTQVLLLSGGSGDVVGFDPAHPGTLATVLNSPANEIETQFSPDGRFISYSSNESGRYEVYVEPWPRTGDRSQVSTNGGNDGRWRHDGNEMFYITQDRTLWSVPVSRTPKFVPGKPAPLFRPGIAGPIGPGHRFPYAVSHDGKHFLMYVDKPGAPPPSLQVIVNWQALLKKK